MGMKKKRKKKETGSVRKLWRDRTHVGTLDGRRLCFHAKINLTIKISGCTNLKKIDGQIFFYFIRVAYGGSRVIIGCHMVA